MNREESPTYEDFKELIKRSMKELSKKPIQHAQFIINYNDLKYIYQLINKQPKLSDGVEEALETLREYFKIDMARFLKCVEDLEQHIQAQASEIKRLKQVKRDLMLEQWSYTSTINAIREVHNGIMPECVDKNCDYMEAYFETNKVLEGNNE